MKAVVSPTVVESTAGLNECRTNGTVFAATKQGGAVNCRAIIIVMTKKLNMMSNKSNKYEFIIRQHFIIFFNFALLIQAECRMGIGKSHNGNPIAKCCDVLQNTSGSTAPPPPPPLKIECG